MLVKALSVTHEQAAVGSKPCSQALNHSGASGL